jgi:hypothetical protein
MNSERTSTNSRNERGYKNEIYEIKKKSTRYERGF